MPPMNKPYYAGVVHQSNSDIHASIASYFLRILETSN
jgi:hypothetical protein